MTDALESPPPEIVAILDEIRAEQIAKGNDPQFPGFDDFVHLAAIIQSPDYEGWWERQLRRTGAPPRVERMARLRLMDVADDGRLDLRDVVLGDDPPDLVGETSNGTVNIELKRLVFGMETQDVIQTNDWLRQVHEVMTDLGQQLPYGSLCYLPLREGRRRPKALRDEIAGAVERLTQSSASLRETLIPLEKPVLLLQWIPRHSETPCRVNRQGVTHVPECDPASLFGLVREKVRQIDSRYGLSGRQRWWLVLHDEQDMISEPLFGAAFADFMASASPIPCRCFERVLLLGDYQPAPTIRGYPIVDVPVTMEQRQS